jgi:ComF family protein
MSYWGRLVASLLDVLAPPACAACDAVGTGAEPFCPSCREHPRSPSRRELDATPLAVAGRYAEPLSTAITRFKYGGRPELSRQLAPLLLPPLAALSPPRGAALVPVPLHPKRLAERGYNQAALLAQELARSSGLACHPRLLARTRDTEHQVGKSRAARLTNAAGAFELRYACPWQVVLVDDVITTGSTVRACAQALARGGVRLAGVVALADADADASSWRQRAGDKLARLSPSV